MKKLFYLSFLLIIGNAYSQSNIKIGERAPNINITDWIKNEPKDKKLSDKYIVLEFWATWCGPCIAAVPHMNDLQKKFNGKDIYYISITDESVAKVQRSLKRVDFHSIVVTDLTKETQINFGDGIKGLDQYPLTVLIDNNNTIKWIGEPKDLDDKVMTSFLGSKRFEEKSIEKNEETKIVDQQRDFLSLMKDKETEYYFALSESSSAESSKQQMGTIIYSLIAHNLEDIYNSIFQVRKEQLTIPAKFENKHYDLLYKNTDKSKGLEQIEKEILKEFNLTKQIESKKGKTNIVTVKDSTLLEETLEKRFSAKSDADDKIIFTAFTIENMLEELSNRSSELFIFQDEISTKYDFIISINSKEETIKSLSSYGLELTEKEIDIEYITLIDQK